MIKFQRKKAINKDFKKAIEHERRHLKDMSVAVDSLAYTETTFITRLMFKEMRKRYKNAKRKRKDIEMQVEELLEK